MTDHQFRPRLESDDDLTRELRSLYAPPAGESYWESLESKILSHVESAKSAGGEWWVFFGDWIRAGVVAAGIAAAAAGLALAQADDAAAQTAFEGAWDVTPEVPVQTASQGTPASAREATLRYVISY